MNIAPEYLARIRGYGYSRTEAQFLYLVATHSGYFTQRQFLRFAYVKSGGSAFRLTQKVLRLGHGRSSRYGCHTFIYNLHSRLIYEPIEKDKLRNCRHLANDSIQTRLMILDFVLGHLQHQYLETEAHKVGFFHRELGLPLAVLPERSYREKNSKDPAKRYFVDRFPIFMPCDRASLLSIAPTFVYCDSGGRGLLRYIHHLRAYSNLLHRLTAFNFVYAAPIDTKFKRAEKLFAYRFGCHTPLDAERVIRYFEIRQLWDSHKTSVLTKVDRQLLREGDLRFQGQAFQEMYQQWTAKTLLPSDVNDVFEQARVRGKKVFSTCILPSAYNIFERTSWDRSIPESETSSRSRETEPRSSPFLRLASLTHCSGIEGE